MPGMVKVKVHAEQLFHTADNGDGTHTTRKYVRGDVFEMPEAEAKQAAEGDLCVAPKVENNAAGTPVWKYPPKTPGAPRAAVEILKADAPVTPAREAETFKPAPAPKPASASAAK